MAKEMPISRVNVPPMHLPKPGRIAADLKIRAQLRRRELAGAGQTDQSMLLFHGVTWFQACPPQAGHSSESVTPVPGQSVTYVPGSCRPFGEPGILFDGFIGQARNEVPIVKSQDLTSYDCLWTRSG